MIDFSRTTEDLRPAMTKQLLPPQESAWNWRIDNPFSRSVTFDDQVFVSGQQCLDASGQVLDPGNIAAQTRHVFENMKESLAQAGLEMNDLVRLNTYYVFDGSEEEATKYWEDMTRVRLEYFPDPGPAATAVRVKGMPYPGQLIQIEGIALRGESRKNRKRIMPDGSWDWSIAVPLSQGWRVGNSIYVGGQISADETGASVHAFDLDAQTRAIYKFIGNILSDAGASFDDLVHIKICFKHDSHVTSTVSFNDRIMDITTELVDGVNAPALTSFGVDLLYPGLVLEIDAMAIIDENRKMLTCDGVNGRYQPGVFSDGIRAGNELWVSGQIALGDDGGISCAGDVGGQTRMALERMVKILAKDHATLDDVVKLNMFIVGDDADIEQSFHRVSEIWADVAPNARPAMTPVRVHELAHPDALVQVDCIAMK
jgi:enamine deaminase RidA (YjgF/YER057c/UK114 family)